MDINDNYHRCLFLFKYYLDYIELAEVIILSVVSQLSKVIVFLIRCLFSLTLCFICLH